MKEVLIVFCKGNKKNFFEGFISQHVQSNYIHCEVIIGNNVYDYSMQYFEGKKKWKLRERIKNTESYKNKNIVFFKLKVPVGEVEKVLYYTEYYFHNHNYDESIASNKLVAFTEAFSDLNFEMIKGKLDNVFTGDPEYIKGKKNNDKTICSHFCFRVIKYIIKNYYKNSKDLNNLVVEIEQEYKQNENYITPGHLYKKFCNTEIFEEF